MRGEIKMSDDRIIEKLSLKSISGKDAKRILEIADRENIDIEAIIDFIKKLNEKKEVKNMSIEEKKDEERFTAEEKKVEKYLEDHKSENLTYRDAVIACLDKTEPETKVEFSEEDIKKRENLKAIENYLSANPRASYTDAVKIILRGEKIDLESKLIEEYMEKNPKATYREAVTEALSLLEIKKKEE